MKEFAFNDACGEDAFSSPDQAYAKLSSVSTGMASLVDAGLTQTAIRLSKPVHEILLTKELNLFEAILQLTKNVETRDQGSFLNSLANKIPLEDELEDECFERIALWDLKDYPGCLGLLLCASSDRIAVTIVEDMTWHTDYIDVVILKPNGGEEKIEVVQKVANVHSDDTADLKKTIIEEGIGDKTAGEIWAERKAMFPNLIFAPSVRSNLESLGDLQFTQAVKKLRQLETSATNWNGRPGYVLDVRGESKSTMSKYGNRRMFTGEDGNVHIYELHASVTDGFRVHVRELPESQKIEVGYIGPHLKVAKRN